MKKKTEMRIQKEEKAQELLEGLIEKGYEIKIVPRTLVQKSKSVRGYEYDESLQWARDSSLLWEQAENAESYNMRYRLPGSQEFEDVGVDFKNQHQPFDSYQSGDIGLLTDILGHPPFAGIRGSLKRIKYNIYTGKKLYKSKKDFYTLIPGHQIIARIDFLWEDIEVQLREKKLLSGEIELASCSGIGNVDCVTAKDENKKEFYLIDGSPERHTSHHYVSPSIPFKEGSQCLVCGKICRQIVWMIEEVEQPGDVCSLTCAMEHFNWKHGMWLKYNTQEYRDSLKYKKELAQK